MTPDKATAADEPLYLVSCSFAQERLWFLEQLHPGTPVYNMPMVLRLGSAVDRATLAVALQSVVDRHEILRTSFLAVDGRPQQVIREALEFRHGFIDLRALPEGERPSRMAALAAEDAALPFDLARPPLLRATLVQAGEADFTLLLCLHHIVADGWSMDLLVEEIKTAYAARLARRPAPSRPAVQYADFAAWQREQTENADGDGLRYWTNALADIPEVLNLPADRSRPAAQTLRGAVHPFVIERELSSAIGELARSSNATFFTVLLAAFEVLLYRYSGQEEFAVGTPAANRPRREFQDLIGLFINLLALPCRVDPEESFRTLIERIRRQMVDALTHQSVPFEKVVEALRPRRDLSASPLFQVMFVLQSTPTAEARTTLDGDAFASDVTLGNGTAKVDLTLTVVEANDRLYCTFEYSSDLFDAETIARMSAHFLLLLGSLIANPELPASRASMISREERNRAIHEWNDTREPLPGPLLLDRLFEEQVRASPQRIAVKHQTRALTYAELDRLAARVAAELRRLGVGPGAHVAVCMRRTLELVATLIGIHKSGAAYVPLDATYPAARNEFILRDSGAVAVATEGSLNHLFKGSGITLLQVDDALPPEMGEDPEPIDRNPDDTAYLIYTSGSTGTPKGVAISHRSAVSFARWVKGAFAPAELGGVLASTSICFDLSVFELFGTLCAGGTVLLVADALDIAAAAAPVTLVNTVPSAARQMLDLGLLPTSVRTINLAGEVLPNTLAQALYAGTAIERVVNLYGPTEDTTYSTMAEVPRGLVGRVVIGRPLANRRAYILDAQKEPVPPGVQGEIHLGGAGVAKGYHDRPDLTKQRFLEDPFAAGGRLFATGDLGRYRTDGALEYLGRADGQIKLRGFRIETGEIRETLNRLAGVEDSLLVPWESRGQTELAAYVVQKKDETVHCGRLAADLAKTLPAYMVPSLWMVLENFPLNANGKVDRRRLPAPTPIDAVPEAKVAPRSAWEKLVTAIWSDVLQRDDIGIRQNFFDLGGHSLLLTQVASRLQQELSFAVPLREYFENTTIESFAARLDALTSSETLMDDGIARVGGDQSLPLSFAQERLWFLDQFSDVRELYNIPWSYPISGPFDLAAFDGAMQDLVRRHETLRTCFVAPDDVPIQTIEHQVELDIDYYNLERQSVQDRAAQTREIVLRNSSEPFDLARAPLIRCAVMRFSAREHVVLLVMHHIVSDGWSLQIFQRDLGELYRARVERRAPNLPELPIHYADFAMWQRRTQLGERTARLLDYWRNNLSKAPPVVTFPEDRPRPSIQTYRGGVRYFSVHQDLKARLEQLARAESTTLYAALLAGFAALLAAYTGEDDIVLGTPISGRHHAATENLIGFFVNTVVIRTHVCKTGSFRDLLRAARGKILEAYDYQDAPFEKIVEELRPERTLRYSPLFQVMFGFQSLLAPSEIGGGPQQAPADGDLAELFAGAATSKFDMTFALTDQPAGVACAVEYNTDLYDAATVDRIAENYLALLDNLIAHPDRALSDTTTLSAAEQKIVIEDFNDTRGEFPADRSFHELFAEQVGRTPDVAALVAGDRVLTYRELDSWIDDWAHELRARGMSRGDRVAVVLKRSLEAVVSFLAIMKAGATFVPLDAEVPDPRLEGLLRDTQPSGVIGHADRRLQVGDGVVWLSVEELTRGARRLAAEDADPSDLAYIIFTSGSTGGPKGVAVEHRSVVNLVTAMHQLVYARHAPAFPLQGTLNAPLFFDGTIERLGMLLGGHTLHLLAEDLRRDPRALSEYLRRHRIDVLDFTPVHLLHMLDGGLLDDPAYRPRAVIVGGEAIGSALWGRLAAISDIDIYNVYGPTECTVNATACRIADSPERPSIGKPLLNTRIFVLDTDLKPVPIGAVGEIFVAGAGLARNYWNRAELTARHFFTIGLAGGQEERIYRTGDRGRWLADGRLQFVGRTDAQVKVQGYRIEPEEVAAILSRHASVKEAVVITRQDHNGNARLAAYVLAQDGATPDAQEIRALARRELPTYMVPSFIQVVDKFPLTASGKLDVNGLPAADFSRSNLDTPLVSPKDDVQLAIARIWSEVLGTQGLGIHDNFFELGGYSLLAIQLTVRMRNALRVKLSPRDVFENPTIAELSKIVAAQAPHGDETTIPAASPGSVEHLSESEVDDLLRQMLQEGAAAQ